jgi:hypothetical protein
LRKSQNRPASGDPHLGAELQVPGGDFLAQAGAAARDQDALALEQPLFEHGVPLCEERLF